MGKFSIRLLEEDEEKLSALDIGYSKFKNDKIKYLIRNHQILIDQVDVLKVEKTKLENQLVEVNKLIHAKYILDQETKSYVESMVSD